MRKIFSVIFYMFILLTMSVSASDIFKEFVEINDALVSNEKKQYYCNHLLRVYENGELVESVSSQCVFSGKNQLMKFLSKNKSAYCLSTNNGYWFYNKNLRSPMKITGQFEMNDVEIQDLLRIDYLYDYTIVSQELEQVSLQRVNKKMVYPYIDITDIGDSVERGVFSVIFYDKNKTPMKELIYHKNIVDGVECFSEIEIRPLVFGDGKMRFYFIESIKEISIPPLLFSDSQLITLVQYFEKL